MAVVSSCRKVFGLFPLTNEILLRSLPTEINDEVRVEIGKRQVVMALIRWATHVLQS